MSSSRRRFLQTSLASSTLVAMGATTIPGFLGRSARRRGRRQAQRADPRGRPAPGRQRRPEHGRAARDRRLQPRAAGLAASARRRSTRSPPRSACTRRWAGWQAAGEGAAGDRPGRGLSQPRPLALPIDGDLGDRPAWRTTPSRWRPAGWAVPSTRRDASRATIRRPCTSAAGRCRRRCAAARPRSPRSRAWRATSSSSTGTEPERKAERVGAQRDGGRRAQDGRPLAGLHPPDDAVGLRIEQPAGAGRAEGRAARSTPTSAWPGASSWSPR